METRTTTNQAPAMANYDQMKAQHPDAVLLVRVGDAYEMYKGDAVVASELLGLTITRRNGTTYEETGAVTFPRQALDIYLPKLVHAGHRVGICDPSPVEMITPNNKH